MKTGTKIAIAVGGATVAGVVLYLVLRPSSAAAQPATATAPAPSLPNSPQNQTVNMPTEPTVLATYSQVLTADAAFSLKVGDTISLKPAPLSGMMQTWTAQNCPTCAWSTRLSGTPIFQFGRSTAPVSGNGNPVIQQIGDGLFKAVGSGTGTIAFIYADPSDADPVAHYHVAAYYHVDVTVQ